MHLSPPGPFAEQWPGPLRSRRSWPPLTVVPLLGHNLGRTHPYHLKTGRPPSPLLPLGRKDGYQCRIGSYHLETGQLPMSKSLPPLLPLGVPWRRKRHGKPERSLQRRRKRSLPGAAKKSAGATHTRKKYQKSTLCYHKSQNKFDPKKKTGKRRNATGANFLRKKRGYFLVI